MKKFIIISFFLLLTGVSSFSQTKKTPVKPTPKPTAIIPAAATVSEIPETEWSEIAKALEAEDWDKANLLSSTALKRLKIDNEKKQLASLRYFYLYSLAGKVQQNKTTYSEFEKISQAFIGKDFLMPSRQILNDCKEKVNYICPVKNDFGALRVTVTNKTGSNILFFEYVQLDEGPDFATVDKKNAFVSGKLTKIESSLKNNIRLIRLFFEEGKAEILK